MAVLVMVLVAACTTGGGQPERYQLEKPRIKLGVLPVVGAASVFLAKDNGYFEAEGLNIEFVTIQGAGAAVPAMASGDLDLVFGNYVSFFTAEAKNEVEVRFLADGYFAEPRTWMVLVGKDSKLQKASDIGGKKVAVTTTSSLADLTVKAVLGTSGSTVTPPTFVEMAYTDMGVALQNHTVDAALLSEPYITDVSKRTGAFPLFDAASGPTASFPISGYATTEKFANANPNTIRAFQRALGKGAALAGTDRTAVEKAVHKFANVDEQTAALMTMVGYPTRLDPTRLQRVPDLMYSYGIIPARLDVHPLILPSAMSDTHP
jgi:NitT/TauT family transport system substrate-binding protein